MAAIVFGIFLGVMLAVGLANVYTIVVMRDRGALLFAFYIFSITAYAIVTNGLGSVPLWPRPVIDLYWVSSFADALTFVAFLLFVRTFLNTAEAFPWIDKLLVAAFGLQTLLSLRIPLPAFLEGFAVCVLPAGMALTIVAAALRARESFPARMFLLGFAPVAVGSYTGAILPAWTMQIIVLSFGIVERIRSLAAEKHRAELRNEQLRTLAYIDPLTGVRNRIAFDEELQLALERVRETQESLAVLFIDLDGFKAVNDSFGHQIGDRILKIVTARLKNAVRASDVVARLGGDEFAIIAPASVDGASLIREKLVVILDDPVAVAGQTVEVGLSVGIGVFPRDGFTADELLAAADSDMYAMKQSHKRARLRRA